MEQNKNNVLIERRVFIFSVFLLTLLILSSVIICYLLLSDLIIDTSEKEIINDIPAFDENTDTQPPIKENVIYELKEYNGKIGVLKNDALVYTLDIYIFTLPDSDKSLLKEGIKVYSESDLRDLIEEYY